MIQIYRKSIDDLTVSTIRRENIQKHNKSYKGGSLKLSSIDRTSS